MKALVDATLWSAERPVFIGPDGMTYDQPAVTWLLLPCWSRSPMAGQNNRTTIESELPQNSSKR